MKLAFYLCPKRAPIRYKPQAGDVYTMMDVNAGLVRFSPMKGNDYTDPSYNTVAFYRMYGEASGDAIWNKIADNSVAYLKKACHPVTGLAADYSEFDGTPKKTPWHPEFYLCPKRAPIRYKSPYIRK